MPEMPEVETMVERLQDYVGMDVLWMSPTSESGYKDLKEEVSVNQRLNGVFRRGKFIIFMLERDAILCHNAMSGYWDAKGDPWTFDYVEGKRKPQQSDVRVELELEDHEDINKVVVLQFHDARKFGSIRLVTPEQLAGKLAELGPEADKSTWMYEPSEQMTPVKFFELVEGSKKPVKELLMDQSKIAGVGNIYASEACWLARVSPFKPAQEMTDDQKFTLFIAIRSVLRQALERRLNYDGLRAYRRGLCAVCKGPIETEKLKGRSTYWCPRCQK